MSGRAVFFVFVFAALTLADILLWRRLPLDVTLGSPQVLSALPIHLGICALAAGIASALLRKASMATRLTLLLLFFMLAAVLPAAGILLAGAMAWIFSSPAGDGLRPEDKFVIGNPKAMSARHESRERQPELRTLVESMRVLEGAPLESLVHGLKHLQPRRQVLQVLRRYQTDERTDLQFAAQGILSSAQEQLEAQLKELSGRLRENPQDLESRLGSAELLLAIASWSPEGDATADICRRDALRHLHQVAESGLECERSLQLQARCHLELHEPGEAQQSIRALDADRWTTRLLEMEARYQSGDWKALPALAQVIDSAPAEFAEVLGFWAEAVTPTPAPSLHAA
ncbi:MAG: hypothetical protein KA004_02280 [Verrucomicrobiales bacterium]|nr:hypothetical protein [Verrucomicrobiales bacterium]